MVNRNLAAEVARRIKEAKPDDVATPHFAEKIGFKEPTVRAWMRGVNLPSVEGMLAISRETGKSLDWLVTGADVEEQNSAMVKIPRYDVFASAGAGALVDGELPMQPIALDEGWVRARGLNPDFLSVIGAQGDSMFPTIRSGAMLVINHAIDRVRADGIYAFNMVGDLYIKRLQKMLDGSLVVRSDNPEYQDQTVPPHEAIDIHVVGEVIWAGDWL